MFSFCHNSRSVGWSPRRGRVSSAIYHHHHRHHHQPPASTGNPLGRTHINDHSRTKLHDACQNSAKWLNAPLHTTRVCGAVAWLHDPHEPRTTPHAPSTPLDAANRAGSVRLTRLPWRPSIHPRRNVDRSARRSRDDPQVAVCSGLLPSISWLLRGCSQVPAPLRLRFFLLPLGACWRVSPRSRPCPA